MSVDVARVGGVVEITLNRPGKRNAMTDAMWARLDEILEEILEEILADPADTRVLVVTGAGGAFCGGSDVSGLLGDPGSLPARIAVSNRCVLALRELPVPTVAKVAGVAAGSGANLALACDFVLASADAYFAQLFVHRGLSVDSGASWLLPRLVGDRKARELCLLGDRVPAREAHALGMITDVVPAADLDRATADLAERLAALSPPALAGTKHLLNRTWQATFREALAAEAANQAEVIETPAAHAAITAFGRNRRP
ncbi:enoyl-CoA hydratase/isomerase family protein [Actinomadura chibensis]|uniref:Enoyl-CoA hydratase n=1 Tax=Actinomadura chibensis TaxID=392828 RepID=A0A5D0NI38_9ACTN|nr:enoyl-CoA hydratase-related protein [Actinomadura chibensis]TYB44090.1 enoyl-CoA hydratase [Actinomadura chibensis]